jgi:hypothetical protein
MPEKEHEKNPQNLNDSKDSGADDATRTHDLLITNQLHYRLCYISILRMLYDFEPAVYYTAAL